MKSILFPQFRTNPLTGWQLNLPKLGKMRINLHRAIPDGFALKQIRLVKMAVGWLAIMSIESDNEIPKPSSYGHCIGVDIGLLHYLATSDGFVEPGRKFFKATYRRLQVLQHRLSKKKKRSANYEKARLKVEKQHNHIAFTRKDYQYKLAHKICEMADSIFIEDIDFRIMAKGFLGKHTVDAAFGQFRSILKYVGWQQGKFVGEVDHRGTSQTCPNCRTMERKELKHRWHSCQTCQYECHRDIASAQEICNRGIETYRGTPEKQEIDSQVVLSGAMSLDKWRRGVMPNSDVGQPTL